MRMEKENDRKEEGDEDEDENEVTKMMGQVGCA